MNAAVEGEVIQDDRDATDQQAKDQQPPPTGAETPEARELRELEEQVRAQEEAAKPAPPAQPAAPAEPAQPAGEPAPSAQQPGTPQPQPATEVTMVPVAAVLRERQRREQAEEALQQERGARQQLESMLKAQPAPAQPAAPEITPEQRLQQIRTERLAKAKAYTDGDIDAYQWEEERIKLEEEQRQIELAQLQVLQQPQVQQGDDTHLALHRAKLAEEHPAVQYLDPEQAEFYQHEAYRIAELQGIDIPDGPIGTMRLREIVAGIADRMYGHLIQNRPQPPAAGGRPQPPQLPAGAQARAGKQQAAAGFPPDVNQLGSAGSGAGTTETELEARIGNARTDDEVIALIDANPTLRKKLMGL